MVQAVPVVGAKAMTTDAQTAQAALVAQTAVRTQEGAARAAQAATVGRGALTAAGEIVGGLVQAAMRVAAQAVRLALAAGQRALTSLKAVQTQHFTTTKQSQGGSHDHF